MGRSQKKGNIYIVHQKEIRFFVAKLHKYDVKTQEGKGGRLEEIRLMGKLELCTIGLTSGRASGQENATHAPIKLLFAESNVKSPVRMPPT